MSKTNKHQSTAGESVGKTLSSAEQFFEQHKNTLFYILIAIVAVVAIYFAYTKLYKEPLREEARGQMFLAEQSFARDSFALALNGDGNAFGFLQIEEEYGSNAGKALPFYIGVCQLHLGQYNEAISSLKKYNGKDEVIAARALCCIGDAYVELNDYKSAYDYFMKAANYRDNAYAVQYLMKAALVCEEMGNTAEALKIYQRIKVDYSQTTEGRDIDKYIGRLNPTI